MNPVAMFTRRPRRSIVIRLCPTVWSGFEVGAFDDLGNLLQIGSMSALHHSDIAGCAGYAIQLFRACRLPIVVHPNVEQPMRKWALAMLHNPERSKCDPLLYRVRRDERKPVQAAS